MSKKQDMEVLDAVGPEDDDAEDDGDEDGDAVGDLPTARGKSGGIGLRKASVGGRSSHSGNRKMSSVILSKRGSVSSTHSSERGMGVAESAENLRVANKKVSLPCIYSYAPFYWRMGVAVAQRALRALLQRTLALL